MNAQIFTWGDISSGNINYSVASVVEGKNNLLFVLGKVTDKDFKNLKIGYSKISTNGEIIFNTFFTDQGNIYDLNSILFQPNGYLRIYGTAFLQNGMMAPYMNYINPENNTISNNITMVSTPHYSGDVKHINNKEIILTKAIKGSETEIFNIYAYRIEMSNQDIQKRKIKLESNFNEEPKTLYIFPDSSFVILGKRYTDQSLTKSMGVIYNISPDFKFKWNMEVLNSSGLSNQSLSCGKEGWIYYFCSLKDKNNESCSSKGYIFDNDGNKLRQIELDSFYVNSVITLTNGNVLIAGCKIQNNGISRYQKASYIIFDRTLKKIKSRTLGLFDKPDADLPSLAISSFPSSSEYISALQLNNGIIVLGGSVYLPIYTTPEKIIGSPRANKYLIAILTKNGDL